jgi:TonB-linked SusC/RagA family outer membrane protein
MRNKQRRAASMLLAMRMTIAQILFSLVMISALKASDLHAQALLQRSFKMAVGKTTIAKAIETMSAQTAVKVSFSSNAISAKREIAVAESSLTVGQFLDQYLKPMQVSYRIVNESVVLYATKDDAMQVTTESPFSRAGVPGSKIISGRVANEKGDAIVSATVTEKGTTNTVATDERGMFTINVGNDNATLLITSVGFESLELPVSTISSSKDIVLREKVKGLEDVVVVGYGARKRRELSTAVSSVGSKEIMAVPVADAAQALQGRVSGVTIVQGSGAPGGTGGTGIRIRGISSLTGTNNPLIVVDGYPLPDQQSDNVLNSFGTGDIESIDVLKDAAAASIYGVRASNGVIMITTKKGRAGKTSLTADVYRGVQEAWRLPTMLDAREYAIANTEARIASGLAPIPKLADFEAIGAQYGAGTNWMNEIFRRAAMQSVNLTASGGSDKAQYMLSAGYFRQDGIIERTNFERFNLRFNGDVKVNSKIKIGNTLTMSKFIERGANTFDPFNSVILLGLMAPPTVSVRNPDGTYAGGNGSVDGFNEPNPIYNLEVPNNKNTKYRINGTIFTEWQLAKSLKFKALFGADFNYQELSNFSPAIPSTGGRPFVLSGYSSQKGLYPDYLAEYTLGYDKIFAGKHKVNAVVGYTYQENRYSFLLAGRGGTFNQLIPALNNQVFLPTDISQTFNASEEGINSRLMSYFGRVNYDFDNRAFFSFSLRRDGSSNFAPANRFAMFPSVSAAWRLSQEKFMERVKWINELKVRASFGYTGNPNVAGFAYIQSINQSFQYTFGNSSGSGGIVPGAAPSRSFNPDIRWEKNEQLNIGVDASLWNSRLNVSVDVYQRRSKDLILFVAPPFVSGTFESVPFNTGTLQNRGIDLTLSGTVLTRKNLNWNANFVLGAYRNEVISMGLSAPIDNGFARINGGSLRTTQGMPANFFFGFVTDGIFQNYDEIRNHAVQTAGTDPTTSTAPGDIRFKDLNGDGIINDQDRTNIGNANPNFTFGFTNNVTYKNWELAVFLQGSAGNKVLNFTRWYTEGGVSNGNYSNDVIDRWTGPGTSNSMPRLVLNDPNGNNRVSDRFVEDASYVRIKNIRLAYNIPTSWTARLGVKKVQCYASAQNLLTLTNYTGMDPEVGGGVDIGFYPQARTFLAGVLLDF